MIEFALQYVAKDWHIFPITPREKAPPLVRWRLESSNDPEKIKEWWTRWPDANIGLDCGKSRLVAIDLDLGRNGPQFWEALVEEYDIDQNTLTCLTGGGGRHLIYIMPDDTPIGCPKTLEHLGIDVKGEGGYVILLSSIHPNGRSYQWRMDFDGDSEAPMPLPPPLIELLQAKGASNARHDDKAGKIKEGGRNN